MRGRRVRGIAKVMHGLGRPARSLSRHKQSAPEDRPTATHRIQSVWFFLTGPSLTFSLYGERLMRQFRTGQHGLDGAEVKK